MFACVRELFRALAWVFFTLAAGSLLVSVGDTLMHQPGPLSDQLAVLLLGSLCFYLWWRLK